MEQGKQQCPVERLESYKEMLLTRMESLMADVERLATQVEQLDQAIAEETEFDDTHFIRGTE